MPSLQRLQGLLDLGIPPASMPPGQMRRIRTISAATFAMIGVALLTLGQSFLVGKWEVMLYLAVSTAAGVGNLALLRATRNPNLAGHVAVTILALLITAASLTSGGFYDPSFGWLYILPLAAAVAVELRGAAIWTAVTAGLSIVFWSLPELGIHLPDHTPAELREANALAVRR